MELYQEYECENCGIKSKVKFEDSAKVYEVVMLVDNDHREKSSWCDNFVSNLTLKGIKQATVAKAGFVIAEEG